MKEVGKLYEVRHQWAIPMSRQDFWKNCGPVVYLGEDPFYREEDGKLIVNHAVLVRGKTVVLDESFLRFLEPYDADE